MAETILDRQSQFHWSCSNCHQNYLVAMEAVVAEAPVQAQHNSHAAARLRLLWTGHAAVCYVIF